MISVDDKQKSSQSSQRRERASFAAQACQTCRNRYASPLAPISSARLPQSGLGSWTDQRYLNWLLSDKGRGGGHAERQVMGLTKANTDTGVGRASATSPGLSVSTRITGPTKYSKLTCTGGLCHRLDVECEYREPLPMK